MLLIIRVCTSGSDHYHCSSAWHHFHFARLPLQLPDQLRWTESGLLPRRGSTCPPRGGRGRNLPDSLRPRAPRDNLRSRCSRCSRWPEAPQTERWRRLSARWARPRSPSMFVTRGWGWRDQWGATRDRGRWEEGWCGRRQCLQSHCWRCIWPETQTWHCSCSDWWPDHSGPGGRQPEHQVGPGGWADHGWSRGLGDM